MNNENLNQKLLDNPNKNLLTVNQIPIKKQVHGSIMEFDFSQELLMFFKTEENFYQALLEMRTPTLLLKYSKNGSAHFRNFYITPNYEKLCWVSPKKLSAESSVFYHINIKQFYTVFLKDCVKFTKGITIEKFKKNKNKEKYENISFSIAYLVNPGSNKNKFETTTIDITCKDSKEFEVWFYGLKACAYAAKHNYDLGNLESLVLKGIFLYFD